MVGPYSIDTFFPSLRAIARKFGFEPGMAAAAHGLHGAVCIPDARARTVVGCAGPQAMLLIGLLLYSLASSDARSRPGSPCCSCAAAGNGRRFAPTIARAVVRDLYDGPDAQRLMSVMMMIFSIAPAIGPIIGGWLHVAFGGAPCFSTMALAAALLALMVVGRLPETLPPPGSACLRTRCAFAANIARVPAAHREFLPIALGSSLIWLAPAALARRGALGDLRPLAWQRDELRHVDVPDHPRLHDGRVRVGPARWPTGPPSARRAPVTCCWRAPRRSWRCCSSPVPQLPVLAQQARWS